MNLSTTAFVRHVVIHAEKFRNDTLYIHPHAGFHKLFPKLPVSEEIKSQCCLPEPIVCFNANVDTDIDFCQDQMNSFLQNCSFDHIHVKVEELTRGQRNNDVWRLSRKKRQLTATNFETIVNCKKLTSVIKTVMGYYKISSSDALDRGKIALASYTKEMKKPNSNISVMESGLLVHQMYPYIGASPDGVVLSDQVKKLD